MKVVWREENLRLAERSDLGERLVAEPRRTVHERPSARQRHHEHVEPPPAPDHLLKDRDAHPSVRTGGARALIAKALLLRPADLNARYQLAAIELAEGEVDPSRRRLEQIVKEAPAFTAAHVTLATIYYRLKRKADGDRERGIVQRLNVEAQAKQQQGINVK